MKIVKPLSLGLLQRPYSQAGRHQLVVCALGFFALGRPVGARLLGEAPQWPRVMAAMPTGQPLDEVMPKAQAEALVYGAACAPEPAPCLRVRLQLGAIDKSLLAFGPRPGWRQLDSPTPVQRVALDYRLAWGGPGCDDNPIGCGAAPSDGPLPQWAYPESPLAAPGQPIAAAGLGPRGIDWTPRRRHAGTYDAAWLREQAPGLPLDLDWRVYNQAAEDQRLDAPCFRGGEAYRLEGLHPSQPVITGRLPQQRARAFVLTESGLSEVGLGLDTVWFLPEQALGVVAWRGRIEVADSDALDVQALMLAYEAADLPARPLTHYASVLAQRLDPEAGAASAFSESQLAPPRAADELAREAEQDAQAAAATAQRQARAQAALRLEIEQRSGGASLPDAPVAPAAQAPVAALPTPSPSAIAAGDFDLGALIEGARTLAETARADGEARRDELQRRHPDIAGAALSPRPPPGADELARQVSQVADARKARGRLAAPEPVAPALPAEQALVLGQQALAWLAAGHSLAGRDLAGANLQGADLSGQDLRACLLEWADLRGARLRGCRLDAAALTRARLDGADLSGAQLGQANLGHARLDDACLVGAVLHQAQASGASFVRCDARGVDLREARLDGADFSAAIVDEARLESSQLIGAQLRDSRWAGAHFRRCVGLRVQARGGDFSGSHWERSALVDADLAGSRWVEARLSQLQGGHADWQAAVLRGVRAERCGWPAARMAGADLSRGLFADCDFSSTDLAGAQLQGACFPRAIFMRARLNGAQARDADFFQALLRKADLSGADLREANLVQAELTEVKHHQARLHGLRMEARRAWS